VLIGVIDHYELIRLRGRLLHQLPLKLDLVDGR
jgi:hypothetical protein